MVLVQGGVNGLRRRASCLDPRRFCDFVRDDSERKKNRALGGRAKQLSSPSQGGSYREVRVLRRMPSKRYDDSQHLHLRECRYRYLIA